MLRHRSRRLDDSHEPLGRSGLEIGPPGQGTGKAGTRPLPVLSL